MRTRLVSIVLAAVLCLLASAPRAGARPMDAGAVNREWNPCILRGRDVQPMEDHLSQPPAGIGCGADCNEGGDCVPGMAESQPEGAQGQSIAVLPEGKP